MDIAAIRSAIRTLPSRPTSVEELVTTLRHSGRAALVEGLSPSEITGLARVLGEATPRAASAGVAGGSGTFATLPSSLREALVATKPQTGGAEVRVLDAGSAEVQGAFDTVQSYLGRVARGRGEQRARGAAAPSLTPLLAEVDELGITHLRMQRSLGGVPILGDHVVAHIRDGRVLGLTGETEMSLGLTGPTAIDATPKLDAAAATRICVEDFRQYRQCPSSIDTATPALVLFRGRGEEFRLAYRLDVTALDARKPDGTYHPSSVRYVVDASTGEILARWDNLGLFPLDDAATPTLAVRATARPGLPVQDHRWTTASMANDAHVRVSPLVVDFCGIDEPRIRQTCRGALRIMHESPPGTRVQLKGSGLADRTRNVFGRFDESTTPELERLYGEAARGTWKVHVYDNFSQDEGSFDQVALRVGGTPRLSGQGDDRSEFYGNVEVPTTRTRAGIYELRDATRGGGIETLDAQNQEPEGVAGDFGAAKPMIDGNDKWAETTDPAAQQAGVDAHYTAAQFYDFLKTVFGRDSIDGKGMAIESMVHVGTRFVNAFYYQNVMHYGDGDGQRANTLTTLDIGGHEPAHGVTDHGPQLIYDGESGGLNEATSDIFGTGLEWFVSKGNPAVVFDWMLGEDTWTPSKPGDALRYMDDPTQDGRSIDHYSKYDDSLDVHLSSGIANNFFTLLVQGGKNRTSGVQVDGLAKTDGADAEAFDRAMVKGLKIWYRALMYYMTPSTTFAQAREATVRAARDLYGDAPAVAQRVEEAWSAVGVEAPRSGLMAV